MGASWCLWSERPRTAEDSKTTRQTNYMKRDVRWHLHGGLPAIVLLFLMTASASAFAQGGDVVAATYGAGRSSVDVTNQVRSMARNGSLNFRVSNDVLGGDPAPNQVKTLQLRVRDAYGRTQNYQYQEGQTVTLQLGYTNPPNRPGQGSGYNGRLNASDQQRFDSYYSRWLDYQRTNNYGEIRSMEKRMYDVYKHYGIPASVPFAQVASSRLGQPGPGWGGWNDLRVTSARYGSGGRVADVTGRLQGMVNNGILRVRVDNDSMGGDPAPNQPKQLHLQYLYQGRQRSMTVREGNYLQIP
jgi:hypothetical protein